MLLGQMVPFVSTVTTKEIDTDSAGKKSTKEITATTSPASTNQYEHAAWRAEGTGRQTILSLQPAGVSAIYLAIYRVTNADDSNPVTVATDNARIPLEPGTSVDISSLNIAIVARNKPAHGSYQNLCCSLAQQQAQAPKTAGGTGKAGGQGKGGNGNGRNGGNGNGENGSGGDDNGGGAGAGNGGDSADPGAFPD